MNTDEVPNIADWGPAWSNDGTRIAYLGFFDSCNNLATNIYITDRTGIPKEPVGIVGSAIRWLPGDSELVISTGLSGGPIIVWNLNSGETRQLGVSTRFPFLDVSLDGRFIYYEGEPETRDSIAAVYQYEITTGRNIAIVQGGVPSISTSGSFLFYRYVDFTVRDLSDSSETTLPHGGGHSDWTPDDEEIVYDDGGGRIWATDLEGNIRLITGTASANGAFGPLHLSPDGHTLLFLQPSDDRFYHIWQVNIDGTGLKQLTR